MFLAGGEMLVDAELLEEYLGLVGELGEPGVEEVEEAAREEQWRKLEKLRGALGGFLVDAMAFSEM